jgi:hypothetical protein
MMQMFTGFEYLLIDVANQMGLDKELFEDRIQWAKEHLDHLEALIDQVKPKNQPLYYKACLNIRRAQAGQPIGALVGFDASCSGIQVMSALTGCATGALHTGLVDPNVRADAYTTCTEFMNEELGGFTIERDLAKDALMTVMYGSSEQPKKIFGKDTMELSAFYLAAEKTAPGAYQLLQELLGAWQPYAPVHQWRLPDGFLSRVRVAEKVSCRLGIDEMGGASFTYVYREYQGTKEGISLPANVTHSVDAYVLRSMVRRCNYDVDMVNRKLHGICDELYMRRNGEQQVAEADAEGKLGYYTKLYAQTGMADAVILPYLNSGSYCHMTTKHLESLYNICTSMLEHKPFEIVTVHDEFKCHPNNMNYLRMHYRNIFAELAESTVLESILNQITGQEGKYQKHSNNLGDLIRNSNYALC